MEEGRAHLLLQQTPSTQPRAWHRAVRESLLKDGRQEGRKEEKDGGREGEREENWFLRNIVFLVIERWQNMKHG